MLDQLLLLFINQVYSYLYLMGSQDIQDKDHRMRNSVHSDHKSFSLAY